MTIKFGKYYGDTVETVIEKDMQYIKWIIQTSSNKQLVAYIVKALNNRSEMKNKATDLISFANLRENKLLSNSEIIAKFNGLK